MKNVYRATILDVNWKSVSYYIRGWYNAKSFREDVRESLGALTILEKLSGDEKNDKRTFKENR